MGQKSYDPFLAAAVLFGVLLVVVAGAAAAGSSDYSLDYKATSQAKPSNEETNSGRFINDLFDENNQLVLNEKTSEYIAEALDRGFDDKKVDLYAIEQLMEKDGYTFEGENEKITEKEIYSLLEGLYGDKKGSKEYELKEDLGESNEEIDLETEVRNPATLDEAEKSDEEANLDSEAPDPGGGGEE